MGLTLTVAAGVKSLRQGEVSQYTELLEDARRHTVDRPVADAKLLGATGIVAMRFIDPGTDRVMRVWVDPVDHARHYVPD